MHRRTLRCWQALQAAGAGRDAPGQLHAQVSLRWLQLWQHARVCQPGLQQKSGCQQAKQSPAHVTGKLSSEALGRTAQQGYSYSRSKAIFERAMCPLMAVVQHAHEKWCLQLLSRKSAASTKQRAPRNGQKQSMLVIVSNVPAAVQLLGTWKP